MKVLEALSVVVLICVSVFMLGGHFGGSFWVLDLFSHFQIQYFITLVFVFALLLLAKSYERAAVALVVCLIALSNISPYFATKVTPIVAAGLEETSARLRVMSFNIWIANIDYDAIADEIHKQDPDVVVLAEVVGVAYQEMSERLVDYPYRGHNSRLPYFDLTYFSRLPITSELRHSTDFDIPIYSFEISFAGKQVRLLAIHTTAPLWGEYSKARDKQLDELTKISLESNDPTIVVGDLNITPWSSKFEQFIEESGLAEARKGRGLLPSWNSSFVLPIRIPIDHVLTKGGVRVDDLWLGRAAGSDHLPILADISI